MSTALAPFLVPAGRHDERSAAQRRADGLVEVARAAMDAGKLPELSGQPAQVQVLVPLPTITNTLADKLTTNGCAEPASLPESPGGTSFLTAPTLERISCDGLISRVLLNAESIPIDMGRAQRLFTPTQRRTLSIRDGGCRFPDCNRPARYTDAHHIVPWTQGGTTDLVNGLLLCRHHHRIIHGSDWRIRVHDLDTGGNGQVWFEGPDQQSLPSLPRGP